MRKLATFTLVAMAFLAAIGGLSANSAATDKAPRTAFDGTGRPPTPPPTAYQ